MIFNKKGETITQPIVVIFILFIVSVFSFAYLQYGQDLAEDPNSYINDDSRTRIFERSGFRINNNTLDSEIISSSDSEDPFFVTGENATGNPKDYALEFQFFRQQSASWRVFAQNLYEIPTFYVWWLGLDYEAWGFIINGINMILWCVIFFVMYKIIRGIIK